jgi:hypothetical protein
VRTPGLNAFSKNSEFSFCTGPKIAAARRHQRRMHVQSDREGAADMCEIDRALAESYGATGRASDCYFYDTFRTTNIGRLPTTNPRSDISSFLSSVSGNRFTCGECDGKY